LDSLEEQLKEFKTKLHLTEANLAELHKVINEIKELSESEVQEQWLDKTLNKFTSWAGRLDKLEKIARTVEKGVDWLDKLPPM
jgi:chaperonin cofactor prefoldin